MEKQTIKPGRVHPLIKGTRYALLIYGIIYGRARTNYLNQYDKPLQLIRKKQLQERKEKTKAKILERNNQSMDEMKKIFKQFSI